MVPTFNTSVRLDVFFGVSLSVTVKVMDCGPAGIVPVCVSTPVVALNDKPAGRADDDQV